MATALSSRHETIAPQVSIDPTTIPIPILDPSTDRNISGPGLQPVIGKPQFNAYSEQYSNNMATGYNQVSNDARALNAPPSQKMITQGQSNSGNGSASRANQQFRQPLRNIFPDNKGSFKPQKAYHTTTDDNSKDVNFSTEERYWEDDRYYDEQQENTSDHPDEPDSADVNFVEPEITYTCKRCTSSFYSNNKLHRHLRGCRAVQKTSVIVNFVDCSKHDDVSAKVLRSKANQVQTTDLASGPGTMLRFSPHSFKGKPEEICLDTGTSMSAIDHGFLLERVPEAKIMKTAVPFTLRGIGKELHDSSEYVLQDIYLPGRTKDGPAIAHITREIHIVDSLKAKAFIGMDIIFPEEMVINTRKNVVEFGSCEVEIQLFTTSKGQRINRSVLAQTLTTIPPNTTMALPIKMRGKTIPSDRDYSFHPSSNRTLGPEGGLFSHITNSQFAAIQVRNTSNKPVILPKNMKVGTLVDYEEEGCYNVEEENRHLAIKSAPNWYDSFTKLAKFGPAAFSGTSHVLSQPHETAQERVTDNGITIYGDSST